LAANTNPISPIKPTAYAFASSAITTANTALTGTGTPDTDIKLFMTAGANGSRVNNVKIVPRGTNASATVLRVFLNNGLTNATPANNTLIAEVTIPINTLSQVAASVPANIALNMVMEAGYRLYYTIGTSVAAGFSVTCLDAGDY
jgi:hypothetical protein